MIKVYDINKQSGSTYFVSSSIGNDSNTAAQAKNQATPWKTITRVNQAFSAITAGDSILFKRGEVFSGVTLTPTVSGVSGRTITFGAYGTGNRPKITGMVPVTGWTSIGNNRYETVVSTTLPELSIVTINDVMQPIGRYPKLHSNADDGYLPIQATSGNTSITSSSLSGGNFVGATIVVRVVLWALNNSVVTSQVGSTVNFNILPNAASYPIKLNYGFFFQNHISGVTANGDWMYNSATKKLTMYSSSGAPTNVKYAALNTLMTASTRNFLKFQDLSFDGAVSQGLGNASANGFYVNNCEIKNIGDTGISLNTVGNVFITYNTMQTILNYGMNLRCSNSKYANISYNTINDVGHIAGMGADAVRSYECIGALFNSNVLISNNRITNVGYLSLYFQGNDMVIKNNYIDNFCTVVGDGAGIYSWNGSNYTNYTGRTIANNIVVNGDGASGGSSSNLNRASGIYCDQGVTGIKIIDNTIYNVPRSGIIGNSTKNLTITGNTIYNANRLLAFNDVHLYNAGDTAAQGTLVNNNMFDNIFFTKNLDDVMFAFNDNYVWMASTANTIANDLVTLGTMDRNIYYLFDPYTFNYSYALTNPGAGIAPLNLGWQQWRLFTSQEPNGRLINPFPQYVINSLGPNLYANSAITSTTGIGSFSSPVNHTLSLDTTGKLTGANSLRLNITNPVPMSANTFVSLFASIGPVNSANNYILRCSVYASTNIGIMSTNFRLTNSPFTTIATEYQIPLLSGRTDIEVLIENPITTTNASWFLRFSQTNNVVWIDNIQVFQANVTKLPIDNFIKLVYNDTDVAKNFDLAGSWADVRTNIVYTAVTIPPFTSMMLTK